jgi:enediyne polyketide synthase
VSAGIAIVGMACVYPEARSPAQLWDNVLAQRRAFRRIPAERLPLQDYGGADPDRTYATHAAVIENPSFDRARFQVSGETHRAVDPAHWLALECAADAIADAGYGNGDGLPLQTTGVLVGNTLTGEYTRASGLRLRWPYVKRVLESTLDRHQVDCCGRETLIGDVERTFKAPFPLVGAESLAGWLSNTIAGRICNHFDLHGGG